MTVSTKLSLQDSLKLAHNKAKKAKNKEACLYYTQMRSTTGLAACVSYESFKGSWAHGEWIKKYAKEIEEITFRLW